MPLPPIRNIQDVTITGVNPVAGTPTGSRINIPATVRGRLIEAGFMPNSLVASAVTMAVAIGNQVSSAASSFSQCITSTLGTFSSTNLFEGAIASCNPPAPTFVNAGDAIQFTTSGGNTSAIGATVYAIIREG